GAEHAVQVVLRPGGRRRLAHRLLDQVLPGRVRGARAAGPVPAAGSEPSIGGRQRSKRRNSRRAGPGPAGGDGDRARRGPGMTPDGADRLVTLSIDAKEVSVPKGTLIIRAAEELGIEIPRFCDHPLLDPVAACRQCYVKVEGQRKLMTSCSTPVTNGMVVFTQFTDEEVKKA